VVHQSAVSLELEPELTVIGSRSGLAQAFVNLILNAGSDHGPDHSIKIRSQREGVHAVVTVSDSGHTMTESQLATLFDPTFGARGKRSAGLGLSISRDIVRAHGGELVVRSQEGKGTVLTVRLPSAQAELQGSA
jgi:signal transduction histidine kinase